MSPASVLVVDVGTSGVRAAIVDQNSVVSHIHSQPVLPTSPADGLVEFDAVEMAQAALSVARAALADYGPVAAVGIANQRASAVVWDRTTGVPIGPGIGWQDLRTVGDCLVLQAEDIRLAPNLSATKIKWLLDQYDPDRSRDLCFGTVDSWIAWTLSNGQLHVSDTTNVALTGLQNDDATGWNETLTERLGIPRAILPRIVDSIGVVGPASALDGAPPIAGIAGDQQASLIGQGCTASGDTKITFGTGGMLDMCLGETRPAFASRGSAGSFPIVARSTEKRLTWGLEAVMLAAGTNVEWLRDDLGVISTAAESDAVAAQCASTDGVTYVPAMLGLGTPIWDYGARSVLLGVTRGTGRPQLVRAVLEGVAQRGADLVDAAEADSGLSIQTLRVDGGMSQNVTFIQALANATQRRIEPSPEAEATTLGAGYLAGLAVGVWRDLDQIRAAWQPRTPVEPNGIFDRERWQASVDRARAWYPELSGLDF